MEKAHSDLTEQILDNDCFDLQGKVQLSLQIIEGISELNAIGIYHRDIKPDNILFVNEIWKIGDLGLCSYKNKFADIDKSGEKIGPIGFLSPEAANKFFTEKRLPGKFDCTIDDKSDIFQLGKVLWFIFKRNVPFGQLIVDDFGNSDIYEVIEMMLQFSKERRADYAFILGKFQQISKEFKLS